MRILFKDDKGKYQRINPKQIKIELSDDVEFTIEITKFGELEINKQQFGEGTSAIKITPCVSNEITVE